MKIFGIGLSKTGTHTLTSALEILGFSSRHWKYTKTVLDYSDGEMSVNFDRIDPFDAFTDLPIARAFRELDKHYPGSKFILTTRDLDSWLNSCSYQFSHERTQQDIGDDLNFDMYQARVFDEEKFRAAYLRHERAVREYFKDRPDDLLVMDLISGEGWEKLCPFLGVPIPAAPFPRKEVRRRSEDENPHETLYFYVPELELYADMPTRPEDYWEWLNRHEVGFDGKLSWTVQTALNLRKAGVLCNITPSVPARGIIISHFDYLYKVRRTHPLQYFVCIKPDRDKVLPFCNMHIVQSESDPIYGSVLWRWLFNVRRLPYWPQPSLVPRDESRGDLFVNVHYFGNTDELEPGLRDIDQQLAPHGLSWEIKPRARWHDYRQTDAIVAVRGYNGSFPTKPASKLVNAWLAGVPAVLSSESAYRRLRRSPLDFIEVHSTADVIDALLRLKNDVGLRKDMVANGRERAVEFGADRVTEAWTSLAENELQPRFRRWSESRWNRAFDRRLVTRARVALAR